MSTTSIRAIALELGVSPSTVSRALRGEGRISQPIREKIRAAARTAGYEVNPLLAQAFSLTRQPKEQRYRETFGLVLEFATETGPDYQKQVHAGAEKQAASLACKVEPVIISGKPREHRRWSEIFDSRGIRGLLIMPRLLTRQPRLHLDWKRFAAVQISQTLWYPRNLHRVETGAYLRIIDAMHLLKKIGYRRIGMTVEAGHNRQHNGVYYAAYLLVQELLPNRERIPIFPLDAKCNEKTFYEWMKTYKPEVLIVHDYGQLGAWIQNLGLRVPEDISLFHTNVRRHDLLPEPFRSLEWTGLRWDYEGMGRRSVEMLNNLLHNGEMGLAGNPRCLQVDEYWVEGKTLSRPITEYITPEGFLKTRAVARGNP